MRSSKRNDRKKFQSMLQRQERCARKAIRKLLQQWRHKLEVWENVYEEPFEYDDTENRGFGLEKVAALLREDIIRNSPRSQYKRSPSMRRSASKSSAGSGASAHAGVVDHTPTGKAGRLLSPSPLRASGNRQ